MYLKSSHCLVILGIQIYNTTQIRQGTRPVHPVRSEKTRVVWFELQAMCTGEIAHSVAKLQRDRCQGTILDARNSSCPNCNL